MRCPFCGSNHLEECKVPGYYSCKCGFIFDKGVLDYLDPGTKTKLECMRSKEVDPKAVTDKAHQKYDNDKYLVVGTRPDFGDYSLLFGQMYFVLKVKRH